MVISIVLKFQVFFLMHLSVKLNLQLCFIFTRRTNYALTFLINMTMSLANEKIIQLFDFTSIEFFNNYVNRIFCILLLVLYTVNVVNSTKWIILSSVEI